jgi:hypothetical protein
MTSQKRKPKTVTTPRFRENLPRRFSFSYRILLCACFSVVLSGANAGASASGAPADSKHDKPYALIFGTVWGPDDRPVYGVKVRIRRANEKKTRWELYSNHSGEFAQRVPAEKADYVIWADLKGFKAANGVRLEPGDEVTVHVEYDERVDTGLHLK